MVSHATNLWHYPNRLGAVPPAAKQGSKPKMHTKMQRRYERWQPPAYCRLSRSLRRELLLALAEWRRAPASHRNLATFWRHTCPSLWRRTGHRPWWLLRLDQRACVGGRFRGPAKCRPAWLVMLTAPRWARMFSRRRACHRQTPLIAPAATGPFPQPRQLRLAI
jgi:hypothetical protein